MKQVLLKNKRKVKIAASLLCLTLIVSVGGLLSFSYMTDSQSIENKFTSATVDVRVDEPLFNLETAQHMVQSRNIPKDPKVVNESSLDIWVFAQVQIPRKNVVTVDSAPDATLTTLFTYTINSNWVELASDMTNDVEIRWYGYKVKVPVGGETTSIFDSVVYADVVQDEISGSEIMDISIDGYGIQSDGFVSMQDAWNSFDVNQTIMSQPSDNSNRK